MDVMELMARMVPQEMMVVMVTQEKPELQDRMVSLVGTEQMVKMELMVRMEEMV